MGCTARFSLLPPPAPQLPPFQTLLIYGDYPASSPFHLCLSSSHHGYKSRPILVTARSQSKITKDLVDLNDDWLTTNAGRGSTTDWLSQIQIFYPGTPDHWALIFSLLGKDHLTELRPLPKNVGQSVSLVVLHEPSAYFLDNDRPKSYTMSSYLRLITTALASLRSLDASTDPPPLVVFDSRLQDLTLPILPTTISDPVMVKEEVGPERRPHKATTAVEQYFDLIGRVDVVPQPLGAEALHVSSTQYRMVMSPNEYSWRASSSLPFPRNWNWRKVQVEEASVATRTAFSWSEI